MIPNPPLLPYLTVSDAAAAIEFYKKAFGAVEHERHQMPGSPKVMNAQLSINGGVFMLADDFSKEMNTKSLTPEALGGTSVMLAITSTDVDADWERAVAAGAIVGMPLKDQFWGDRWGQVHDPFGHSWSLSQPIAKLSAVEVEKAAEDAGFKA